MIIIEGTVIAGLGAAAQKLPELWPTIVRFIPAIQQCEQRTINIQLRHALHVKEPDLTIYVPWGLGSENISIIEIELEYPVSGPTQQAWIYYPHNSPHRRNPFIQEIVTSKIANLQPLVDCRLHLLRGAYVI
jgi:hypothetical protein